MIVQDPNRAGEAEFPGAPPDHNRVFGIANSPAQHGIDGDPELGVASEPFEFPVKRAQALLWNVVGYHIVDADLQIIESGAIQSGDTVRSQE
jgi:hypothetical protein